MAESKKASSGREGRAVKPNGDERSVGAAISGSQAKNFQRTLFRQTMNALWTPSWKTEDELKTEAQAAIDAMEGLAPRNEAEGMLAAQMVATHTAAMECYRRAMKEGQTFEGREANLKHAQRLTKAYMDQLAALDKHRGRGQQKITVEHVTVEAGGQAIVGSVEAGAARGDGASDTQSVKEDPPGFDPGDPGDDPRSHGGPERAAAKAHDRQRAKTVNTPTADDEAASAPPPKVRRRTRPKKPD